MDSGYPAAIVWMRRDLRLADHTALEHAAQFSARVVCTFVLDPELLRGPRVGAPIVQFFFDSLTVLREHLRRENSDLALLEGDPAKELIALAARVGARAVYFHRDFEPEAIARDERVSDALRAAGIAVYSFIDHVYFGPGEITATNGDLLTSYSQYRRRWEANVRARRRPAYRSEERLRGRLCAASTIGRTLAVPQPEAYGHARSEHFPRAGIDEAQRMLAAFLHDGASGYPTWRNIPGHDGTSRLSPHLRAGTIGIRTCVNGALERGAYVWLGELISRDYFAQILCHAPSVATGPYLEAARDIPYRFDETEWRAWCEGRTGYPIVDAAMLQLNRTGWMHNRLRMITASFLTKHLLFDYRLGERYFEQHLADADLASNNGGWQRMASTGPDAQPYLRVFNPMLQAKRFDPRGVFVRTMLPVLADVPDAFIHEPWRMLNYVAKDAHCIIGRDYPEPIVDHATARARAIAVYGGTMKRDAVKS
jgi:deoxyribodipyrimidine photo-lyase